MARMKAVERQQANNKKVMEWVKESQKQLVVGKEEMRDKLSRVRPTTRQSGFDCIRKLHYSSTLEDQKSPFKNVQSLTIKLLLVRKQQFVIIKVNRKDLFNDNDFQKTILKDWPNFFYQRSHTLFGLQRTAMGPALHPLLQLYEENVKVKVCVLI